MPVGEPESKTSPAQTVSVVEIERKAEENIRMARHYWMLYLGLALSSASVDGLFWLASQKSEMTAYTLFDRFLADERGVKDAAARVNAWNGLQQNGLADAHGAMVNITLNGRIFLKWLAGQWRPLEQDLPDV